MIPFINFFLSETDWEAESVMEEIWDMMKAKTLAFMTMLMLALTGCGKEERDIGRKAGEYKKA